MPSDETTLLVPEVNSLKKWRRKCWKHFSWRCFFWFVYSLLLMTDVAVSIHYNFPTFSPDENGMDTSNNKTISFTDLRNRTSEPSVLNPAFFLPPTARRTAPPNHETGSKAGEGADISANKADDVVDIQYAECIFSSGLDTLNCWIFLVVVATSQLRIGCLSTLRNLIWLPRFWTLLFLLALYVSGCLLYLIHFPALLSGIPIGCLITDILHAFTMIAMVGILNYAEVRNLVQGRSRYKKVILKGVLFVFLNNLLWSLIKTIYDVNFTLFLATDDTTLITPVTNVLLLPFVTKITDLLWTKICHDNKCIIGKYQSDSFNKQNTV